MPNIIYRHAHNILNNNNNNNFLCLVLLLHPYLVCLILLTVPIKLNEKNVLKAQRACVSCVQTQLAGNVS